MALEYSRNWKKLQAVLKQESKEVKTDQRRKIRPPRRQQNPYTKCKYAERRVACGVTSISPANKRARMGLSGTAIECPTLVVADNIGFETTSIQNSSPPVPNSGLSKGIETGQYIAMDCEMVGVGKDQGRSALARVSIVNYHGIQVYDSFVKPKEMVTDWRTHVSGVSSRDMSTARSFDEVQYEVAQLLKGRTLIGHDLRHDLKVLMLVHPRRDIRDTSRFSGFRKYNAGKIPGLKKLAKEILGVDIQEGQHSSVEDSRAAMLLFRRYRQAFDAEHLITYPQRKPGGTEGRTNQKRKGKSKH